MDQEQARPLDFFIFVGEKSGDLLGADLIASLLKLNPALHITAVAGPKMRGLPIGTLMPMENFEVMGFIDVIAQLPKLARHFKTIKRFILTHQPKKVIFIDYPGFNLRMAKALRKGGYTSPLIQYVCPTIWAWKKNRLKTMVSTLDLVLTLFPFEVACFNGTPLRAHYVGHPLLAQISPPQNRGDLLALFPGSRVKEVERNLPLQLKVAARSGLPIGLSVASPKLRPLIETISRPYRQITLFDSPRELMARAAFAIAKSGTVNLELALFEVPTVVTYAITKLDFFLARKIFKIDLPHYSLPNIIADQEIFPELYGPRYTEANLQNALETIQAKKEAIIQGCRLVRHQLTEPLRDQTAAHLLLCLPSSGANSSSTRSTI